MQDLTQRQIQILKAIIDEYVNTAEAVGSQTLEKKYDLGVSPATIRNEMVELTEKGYLRKVHSSAGRTPTPAALKYYVNNLLREQNMTTAEEVAVREKVWDYRHEFDKLVREVTRELANSTGELAISTTNRGDIYTAGVANILDSPEFYDIDVTKAVLGHLDEFDYWQQLLERYQNVSSVACLLGSELGGDLFETCGYVYGRFESGPVKGTIGVIGPARVNYNRIYPTVRYFSDLISDIFKGW